MTLTNASRIHAAALAFVDEAFAALTEDHVVPPSRYHPYLRVGRDYEGGDVNVPTFADLKEVLESSFPERFALPLGDKERDFADLWVYSLLEASIARCSRNGEAFVATSIGVEESTAELLTAMQSRDGKVSTCRLVAHLTTADGGAFDVGDVHVVPVQSIQDIANEVARHIPGGYSAFGGNDPWPMEFPLCLITASDRGIDRYAVGDVLSRRLERFLRLVRLLTGTTTHSIYEITGEATLVRWMNPASTVFQGSHYLVKRTAQLSSEGALAIESLGQLLDSMVQMPPKMMVTSFGMALSKFASSFQGGGWDEQIVDLMTAFEGALSGTSKTDVILRLKTRAAALLAESDDPAKAIFEDIDHLYDLRSKLVHGGSLTESELRKRTYGISTVPDDSPAGTAAAHMVDRLRDLVRRALLMRICLASGPTIHWPIDDDRSVDSQLADDALRSQWRQAWHDRLVELGAPTAYARISQAVDFFSPEGG